MTWTTLRCTDATWDALVDDLNPPSPFSGAAWSTFRERDGWRPVRLATQNRDSLVQFLIKRPAPGVVVAWSPGGPLGLVSQDVLASLRTTLRTTWPRSIVYGRLSDFRSHNDVLMDCYTGAHWLRGGQSLTSSDTLIRHLVPDEAEIRSSYSDNWSRNLQRGQRRCGPATLWSEPNFAEMATMYQELSQYKGGFNADWRGSRTHLEALHTAFGSRLLTMRVADRDGTTLSYRSAVLLGQRAFDLLAATSLLGRKCYASHVVTDGLLQECSRRACTEYDFAGVDKLRNKGVFDFKKGAGGESYSRLGEFDMTAPRITVHLMRLLISLRVTKQ